MQVFGSIPLGLSRNVSEHLFILKGVFTLSVSLLRNFAKYASLNILGMVSVSCYILADTYFVAHNLGATGLAALNLSIPLYSVIHGIGLMIGIGGATRYSILQSQAEQKRANKVFATALQVGIVIGLLLALLGLLGSNRLAGWLGADTSTLAMTRTYLATILLFAPLFITNNIVQAFVRNDHNPRLAMLAMVAGSLSNILLDYVFMYIFDLGMFGAAFATSLAPLIGLCVLPFHFRSPHRKLAITWEKLKWKLIPDLFSLGTSALILELSSAAVLITFNLVILGLEGNFGVAAYGIVANLGLVAMAVFTGLAQGSQPLISRAHGIKSSRLTRKVRGYALKTALIMAVLIYLTVLFYSEQIVAAFNTEQHMEISRLAKQGLSLYFLGFLFLGINIVVTTYLSATEQVRDAFFIAMARGFVIIIPLVLVLSQVWGMAGVWLAFVFTECAVTVFTAGASRLGTRNHLKSQEISI